jgi:Ca2+-binding RTX toxin-like protein
MACLSEGSLGIAVKKGRDTMAFGHGVKRGGFDDKLKVEGNRYFADDGQVVTGDEQIKGSNGDNTLDGADGDDVIIGYRGADLLIGGDGEDDLSGGGGGDQDTLVGGILDGDDPLAGAFTPDEFSDDFNAEASFEENGSDLIRGYDDAAGESGVVDVIDFSDAIDFVDPTDDGTPTTDEEKEAQLEAQLSYDPENGNLSDTNEPANVWFNVTSDYEGTTASTVYVEVDGDVFMWDGTGWDMQQDWDLV